MGIGVANVGDLDENCINDLVVGAHWADEFVGAPSAQRNRGAIWTVFLGDAPFQFAKDDDAPVKAPLVSQTIAGPEGNLSLLEMKCKVLIN